MEESVGSLGMRALHSLIQKLNVHHLLKHLILTQILFTDTNHTTKQVDQDTRSIESIRKIEDRDHQTLIVQYHLDRKHRKHKHHSAKHHKKHKHLKHSKHEQCKADNGIYNGNRESGIR